VFAVSSGEFVRQARENQGGLWTVEDRASRSKRAVLYAFDAETGKELYSSGDLVTSFTHFATLTIANGKILFGTYDSTLYCFGFRRERQRRFPRDRDRRARPRVQAGGRRHGRWAAGATEPTCGAEPHFKTVLFRISDGEIEGLPGEVAPTRPSCAFPG